MFLEVVRSYGLYKKHLCTLKIEMDKMNTRLERVTRILEQISGNQTTLQAKLEACEDFVEVSEESEEESMPTKKAHALLQ
jgi:hypothetical protein